MKRILIITLAFFALSVYTEAQWLTQSSGFSTVSRGIRYMCVVDSNTVWAVAYDGSGTAAPCEDFTRTTNGGTLWTPGTIPGITALDLAQVTAIDGQTAWILAFPPASTTTGMGVYKTTNGGTTWTHQTTALFSNASSFPDCIHFFNADTGWCLGDPINGDFEMYTTVNGGTTWTAVPGAQIPNPVTGEFGVIGYSDAVHDTLWFGTNKGRIYKSVDEGHNWTVAQIPGWTAKYVDVRFKDGTNGIAQDKSSTTTGALAESHDGGASWTIIPPNGNAFTDDFAYIPGSPNTYVTTGAATGLTGVTYSFNGGHKWNDMAATIGTQFLATRWYNNSIGWAGGFNTDAITDGMYRWNGGALALPVSAFTASDTLIDLGGSVTFTNQSSGSPTAYAWNFQGGLPLNWFTATPPAVSYNSPGFFDVQLITTNDYGKDTLKKTAYIHVAGVGITNLSNSGITVYPNPVKDLMNVQANNTVQDIRIYNNMGQEVITMTVNAKTFTVNTSGLASGVYTLKGRMSSGSFTTKFIVE